MTTAAAATPYDEPAVPEMWQQSEPPADLEHAEPRGATPHLEFHTLAELRAKVAARGPRKWLLRGIWPAGDYGVHAAEAKAQKTWTTADLAVAVASGTPWLGLVEVETPGPVVMFVGEGGDGNTVRRLSAAAAARGVDPDTLPIHICTRAPHLSNSTHMIEFAAKVEAVQPTLVTLDPLYLAARGAELGDLYKMGAMLEVPQRICQAAHASLWVVTHFNRKAGSGAGRITGAGPTEWGRVLLSATVKSRRTDADTKATTVITELDVLGGEIADQRLRVVRRIWADDANDIDSPLHLETAATPVEDASPTDPADSSDQTRKLTPSQTKLIEAMQALGEPAPIRKLVDWIVEKHGHGLTRETCSRALGPLLQDPDSPVDKIPGQNQFEPDLWLLRDLTDADPDPANLPDPGATA